MSLPLPLSHPFTGEELDSSGALTGLLSHLDAVYALSLALTADADRAADLTERVFDHVPNQLWSTLGGFGLRERLLARCVVAFAEFGASPASHRPAVPVAAADDTQRLEAAFHRLSWRERAAVSLVDQLGLTYSAGAAVLGVERDEFRTLLHGARDTLLAAYRIARA